MPERTIAPPEADPWQELCRSGAVADLYRGEGVDPRFRLDPHRLRALLTEADERLPLGPALAVCVQVASALPILLGAGPGPSAAAAERVLAGRARAAFAVTDAGAAGSDLMRLTTTAELGEERIVLDGTKRWIVGAGTADVAVVLARYRSGEHFADFVLVLVPLDAPGVSVRPTGTSLYSGAGLGEITFDRAQVPRSHLIGRPGRGMAEFVRGVSAERLASALWANALTRRVLSEVHERLRAAPVWREGAVRQRFAEAVLLHRQLDALCEQVVRGGREASPGAETAALKAVSGRAVNGVLDVCAQLSGADGFLDGGVQRLRAEAAMFGIAGGSTEVLLGVTADNAAALMRA